MHPIDYEYELHAGNTLTQPFPVVTHPNRIVLHAISVIVKDGASVHAIGLHAVDPDPVLTVQAPLLPIIPVHPAAIV